MDSVTIDPNGDLMLEVTQFKDEITYHAGQAKISDKNCRFKVSKAVLVKHSTTFENMLAGPWKESHQNVLKIEDRVNRMKIIFEILHSSSSTAPAELKDLMYLVEGLDYYNVDIKLFEQFFSFSYDKLTIQTNAKKLLFLAWRFDHAEAFAHLTKVLAYSSVGHIQEVNQFKELRHLHLPTRIIQQLNAAKGRLRVILNSGLFAVNEQLLRARCLCRKETLFDYEKYLYDLGVWPVEKKAATTSINDFLALLDKFDFQAKESACINCKKSFKRDIEALVKQLRSYFDGLCLDCVDRSKPKFGSSDDDYWMHDDMDAGVWDLDCRIKHGEPTWYFSFMGRKEDMDQFLKNKRSI